MHHAADLTGIFLFQDLKSILRCVPTVDDEWKFFLPRDHQLLPEPVLLQFLMLRLFMPVIIQTDFTHSYSYLPTAISPKFFHSRFIKFSHIIRMYTYSSIDKRIFFCQCNAISCGLHTGAHIDHTSDTILRQLPQQFLTICVKRLIIIMRMSFYDHISISIVFFTFRYLHPRLL